jgi:hypothetical protein
MTSITLWLLISIAGSQRPATVIERFHTELQCQAAADQFNALQTYNKTGGCIRVEAAR